MVDFNLLSEGKADTLNTVESHMNVQTEGETGRQQEEVHPELLFRMQWNT